MTRWAVKVSELRPVWLREPGDRVCYVRDVVTPTQVVTMQATRAQAEGFAAGFRDALRPDSPVTRIWVEAVPDPQKTAPPQSGRP